MTRLQFLYIQDNVSVYDKKVTICNYLNANSDIYMNHISYQIKQIL